MSGAARLKFICGKPDNIAVGFLRTLGYLPARGKHGHALIAAFGIAQVPDEPGVLAIALGGQPTKRDGEWLLAGGCKLQRMEPTQ